MDELEWALPPEPGIKLTPGELLLLDWVLCAASRLLPEAGLDELMKWHDFRLSIWRALNNMATKKQSEIKLCLTDPEARAMLALAPTSFRWGTGPDVGYTLKEKLSKFLMGELKYDDQDQARPDPSQYPRD